MRIWIQSVTKLVGFTLLTGFAYPLVVTGIGSWLWPAEVLGLPTLISRKTTDPGLFWPRPSAADFATRPSGASNLAPSNLVLREQIAKRRELYSEGPAVPPELLLTSGSGLDPHLTPEAAKFQLSRICRARAWDESRCRTLEREIDAKTEYPTLGFLGRARVNVNVLNGVLARAGK